MGEVYKLKLSTTKQHEGHWALSLCTTLPSCLKGPIVSINVSFIWLLDINIHIHHRYEKIICLKLFPSMFCIPLYHPVTDSPHSTLSWSTTSQAEGPICVMSVHARGYEVLWARSNLCLRAGSMNTTNPSINQSDTALLALSTVQTRGGSFRPNLRSHRIICNLDEWTSPTHNFMIVSITSY